MSYVLVKDDDGFSLIDFGSITGGVTSRGMSVQYKDKKKKKCSARFVNSGTLTDMRKQMSDENAKLKGDKKKRGRPRKAVTKGFVVNQPNRGADSEEEMEEEGVDDLMVLRNRGSRARSPTPVIISGDTSLTSSPARGRSTQVATTSATAIDTDALRVLLSEQLVPLKDSVRQLKQSIHRLEGSANEDTNALESITHKESIVKLIEQRDKSVTDNLAKVSNTLERVAAALPSTPTTFDYRFISKDYVDLYDENNNLLIFASRIDELLFPNDRHLRLEDRDPVKVKWLYDLLCHRRKISIGPDRTQRLKQVRCRLNANVWAYNNKTNQPREPRVYCHAKNGRFVSKDHANSRNRAISVPIRRNYMSPVSVVKDSQSNNFSFNDYDRIPYRSLSERRSPTIPPRMSNLAPSDYSMQEMHYIKQESPLHDPTYD